jgi:hypothetical protein
MCWAAFESPSFEQPSSEKVVQANAEDDNAIAAPASDA